MIFEVVVPNSTKKYVHVFQQTRKAGPASGLSGTLCHECLVRSYAYLSRPRNGSKEEGRSFLVIDTLLSKSNLTSTRLGGGEGVGWNCSRILSAGAHLRRFRDSTSPFP